MSSITDYDTYITELWLMDLKGELNRPLMFYWKVIVFMSESVLFKKWERI